MAELTHNKVRCAKQLTVRVDAEMLAQIEKAKADNHMNTSEVIRYALLGGTGNLALSDKQMSELIHEFRKCRENENLILTKLGNLLVRVSKIETSFTKMVRKVHQAGFPIDEKKTKSKAKLLNKYLDQFTEEVLIIWELYTSQVQEMVRKLLGILKAKGITETKDAMK